EDQVDRAGERAEAALAVEPRQIQARYMLAKIAEGRKDYETALRLYREVLQLSPQSVAAQLESARLQLALGDHDGATDAAEQAVQTRPDNVTVQVTLLQS